MAKGNDWRVFSFGRTGRLVSDAITVPQPMWLGWVDSVVPVVVAPPPGRRLVGTRVPNGFRLLSFPPKGDVVLMYSDGTTENRFMSETAYEDLLRKEGLS